MVDFEPSNNQRAYQAQVILETIFEDPETRAQIEDCVLTEQGFLNELQDQIRARIPNFSLSSTDQYGFHPVIETGVVCIFNRPDDGEEYAVVKSMDYDGSLTFVSRSINEDGQQYIGNGVTGSMNPPFPQFAPMEKAPSGCFPFIKSTEKQAPYFYSPQKWDKFQEDNPLIYEANRGIYELARRKLFVDFQGRHDPWINLYRNCPEIALDNWVRWGFMQNSSNN